MSADVQRPLHVLVMRVIITIQINNIVKSHLGFFVVTRHDVVKVYTCYMYTDGLKRSGDQGGATGINHQLKRWDAKSAEDK